MQWRDPDDRVVHIIHSQGQRTRKYQPHEHLVLHKLSIDEIVEQFSRIVVLRCGRRLQIDNDECILPEGEALLQVPPPLLRPWLTTRDPPTCILCVSCSQEQSDESFKNEWGYKIRGA